MRIATIRHLIVLGLCIFIFGSHTAWAGGQKPSESGKLTVNDVVEMVKVKLADDLIIAQIQQNGTPFKLSATEMVQLKTAGASDNVIRAMMEPKGGRPVGETPTAAGSSVLVPSEADGQRGLAARVSSESEGRAKLASFRKTDGQSAQINGVPVYSLEFEGTVEFTQDCKWLREMFDGSKLEFKTRALRPNSPNELDNFFEASQFTGVAVNNGAVAGIAGAIVFERSENGWRHSGVTGKITSQPPRADAALGGAAASGKPSPAAKTTAGSSGATLDPGEALVTDSTKGDQNADAFPVQSRILNSSLDAVWKATHDVFAKSKDEVATEDREKGLIVTALTKHGSFPVARYDKFAIALQKVNDNSTRVTLKALLYSPLVGKPGMVSRPPDRVREQGAKLLDQVAKAASALPPASRLSDGSSIGPDTRTPAQQQGDAAVGKGFLLYSDFVKNALLLVAGSIPWAGIGIEMVSTQPSVDKKLDALVTWLAEGQLKSPAGLAYLKRVGEGKEPLLSAFDVLAKTKTYLQQAGIPVDVIEQIAGLVKAAK